MILFPINIFGQTENINSGKYHPAKEIFETKYEEKNYIKIPNSQIKVEKHRIIFNNVRTTAFDNDIDVKAKLILSNGLLNPYDIIGSFNLRISAITELPLLNPNFKTKRYKFWIFSIAENSDDVILANPVESYFELQNENAESNTSFEEFISNAKLTFLSKGEIIL